MRTTATTRIPYGCAKHARIELDVAGEDPLLIKLGSICVYNAEFVRVAKRVITTAVKVFRTTYNVVVLYLRKRILEVL
jgi:hypothetical protein